jgi:hypothetical protein
MRPILARLLAVTAGVTLVASCDSRFPTTAEPIGGSSSTSSSTAKPSVAIDTPLVNSLVNVGDSILLVMRLHDARALRSLNVTGYRVTGSADLGTLQRTVRYGPVDVPSGTPFRASLRDTTIRRYLKAVNPADTTLDSLVIVATVTDSAGSKDSTLRTVNLVAGPKVAIISPASGDSTPAGIGLSVIAQALHPDGVALVTIHAQGEANWPTKFDTTVSVPVTGAPRDFTTLPVVFRVPNNAPIRGRVTLIATAVSTDGQPGASSPVSVFVRSANAAQPLVNQTVADRVEIGDSITIVAHGDGIASLGYVARDFSGTVVVRDSVLLPPPFAGNATAQVSTAKIPIAIQGQRVAITSFAVDQSGRTGYAVKPSQLSPQGNLTLATTDSTIVVFGHTYPLPSARNTGLVGDLVWDPTHQQVVLSNLIYNRLEVFHAGSKSYEPSGIAVGAFPWGLFVSNDPNVLWVANSGGTNFSRVDLSGLREMDDKRIRTRLTPIYTLTEDATQANDTTPPIYHESISDPAIFSDRPQYIGQLSNGTVFFSTEPTTEAPKGQIRYFDPTQPFPDAKPILTFKKISASIKSVVITNADSVFIFSGAPGSDFVTMCDHDPGTNSLGFCATTNRGWFNTLDSLRKKVPLTDITITTGVDITDAGLTDTTYVGVSGDRNWIGFGSGHTAGAGNMFMASAAGFFSPPITQLDLTNNAAEHINGMALDSVGLTIAAHGDQSFFASVDVPFHLRLQGKYQNPAAGQGIVFHPQARASAGDMQRTAYMASNNQSIDIVDIFHYLNRGSLPIKANLYGPLRAAMPGPGDAPDVVLKLFGVSRTGLVIIDLRARDILPSP